MTRTLSTMRELGSSAVAFSLPNYNPAIDAKTVSWSIDQHDNGLLVVFICNHCPYVVHIAEQLAVAMNTAQRRGLTVIAINSNDIENYAADRPEHMATFAKQFGFEFPYLFDQDQSVAKAYTAACTPDFFLYDAAATLVYRGQFDAARPGNSETVTGVDLMQAVEQLLAGENIDSQQTPSMGCNIKWQAGNAPDYFPS